MTNRLMFDPEQFNAGIRSIGKVFAEAAFRMTAQSALGHMLGGNPDQAAQLLDAMTEQQRLQLWIAARALTALAAAGLDQGPDEQAGPERDWTVGAWRTAAHHYIGIVGHIEEYANQLDELAGPDRDWSVRATDTATKLRALITDDPTP